MLRYRLSKSQVAVANNYMRVQHKQSQKGFLVYA